MNIPVCPMCGEENKTEGDVEGYCITCSNDLIFEAERQLEEMTAYYAQPKYTGRKV